jgi:transcriptional regulator with XRE-family HTH domain
MEADMMNGDQQGVARRTLRGARIREIRERRGLSQAEVASGLDKFLKKKKPTGSAYISMLENERRQPSLKTLSGLAEVLRCDASEFFGDEPLTQAPVEDRAKGEESRPQKSTVDLGHGVRATVGLTGLVEIAAPALKVSFRPSEGALAYFIFCGPAEQSSREPE